MFTTFWHKTLRRPFQLIRTVDQGTGRTVVLLHGIGSSGHVWQHVVERLSGLPYRVVAFDLLGFGASPKPNWIDYTVDDHASAVIASLVKLKSPEPIILVGHSMGCLVAVRVARLRPDLIKHLVLYEMPLYEGLPDKLRYRLRLDLYYALYQRVLSYTPTFDAATAKLLERVGRKIAGFEIDEITWQSFVKSLQHTIMNQTAADDILQLDMPMDVIYGAYDVLVIRGKPRQSFGDSSQVTAHTVRAGHAISDKASRFIVSRIVASEQPFVETASLSQRVRARARRRV